MDAKRSRDLLSLEQPTPLEKKLCIWREEASSAKNIKASAAELQAKPSILSRVKAFLPEIDQANSKLTAALEEKGAEQLDIQTLTNGEDAPHVQMDLALGVAELYTPEAIAAAYKAVDGQVQEVNDDESEEDDTSENERAADGLVQELDDDSSSEEDTSDDEED